ncbi:MAG TPA: pentapeptide repeat-containing protein [Acidobacteriota bacterium]|nr:pentapeptide repeat-containing protein [Acidobacteriota bacterium]HMZ79477.1 pentapeptide repeat-containing protein [Acidobacteriota bacterium]HNB70880.1 pentapeptide repeat-containing protein [Acidobacteriota bacterium]HND18629.1 pentapeptide repeat-containing protein [Acidobacteriota bacterium]HNH83327.1 pentapeptide repeat-containing protein [Acidobacteriota bacterium]
MAEFSREEVIQKVANGEGLERADLRDLKLAQAQLEGANLRRADLEGVDFEESVLRKANLASANLRDAFLARANLEGANLRGADLESANLEGANLSDADLSRTNLEGANLENANLSRARLNASQLALANLGGARLDGAVLSNADLQEAYLGGASMVKADFQNAVLEKANLEEADLTGANLRDASMRGALLPGANLTGVILERAVLADATLQRANFTKADCRHVTWAKAQLSGAIFNDALVYGGDLTADLAKMVKAEWVDFSKDGDGSQRVKGSELVNYLNGLKEGGSAAAAVPAAAPVAPSTGNRRYFGRGDVLRDAKLEFDTGSIVEVEGRFLKCSITLGDGAQLIIGKEGLLDGCRISGNGIIIVYGRFIEDSAPGIDGAKQLIVGATGSVKGMIKQPPSLTQFAFEPGCFLRLKIATSS